MTWKHAAVRRGACCLLALGLLIPASTLAQSGHQPISATPEAASPVASAGASWQVDSVAVVDIDGTPIALSPDGQWLAGIGPNDSGLCVWDVATLEATCDTSDFWIREDSITWSPDSSAVAFTEDVFIRMDESDIHVFELETGESVNLTDDGQTGGVLTLTANDTVSVDAVPTWAPDSQSLWFARSDIGDSQQEVTTDLMTISRQGGESELVQTLAVGSLTVYTAMFPLSDGSLVYAVIGPYLDGAENGIWVLSPDGNTTQVMQSSPTSEFPQPVVTDVHEVNGERLVTGYSASRMTDHTSGNASEQAVSFVLNLDTGEVTSLNPSGIDAWQDTSFPVFSPDGGTVLTVLIGATDGDVVVLQGAESTVLTLGPGNTASRGQAAMHLQGPQWTDDGTVFIPRGNLSDPYLLTLSQG